MQAGLLFLLSAAILLIFPTASSQGLSLQLTNGDVVISWDKTLTGAVDVEHSTDLTDPSSWITLSPGNTEGSFQHALGNATKGFYRLGPFTFAPPQAPASVQELAATATGVGSLLLSWNAPPGGATSYTVTMTTTTGTGSSTQTQVTTNTSLAYTELSPANSYSFSVTASNASGTGIAAQTSFGQAPSLAAFANPDASGEDLIYAWFGLLDLAGSEAGEVATSTEEVEAGMRIVRPYLDPAFTLMRATGQRYTAGNYVPLDIDAFELSDFVETEPRDDIRVIRFFVKEPGATSPDAGAVMSDEKAPRIVVARWDEGLGHWVMVSYANFNRAIAAICEQEPITVRGETANTSPEDVALGTWLVKQWRDITTGESNEWVLHPDNQIQLADGQGWPALDGEPIEWAPAQAYDFANVGVARNGDLLVVSFDAAVSDLVMEGDEFRDTASPRMLTYLLSPEGKWELIALANFNVPEGIPADADCVSLGS
jgi:hypothetical protein